MSEELDLISRVSFLEQERLHSERTILQLENTIQQLTQQLLSATVLTLTQRESPVQAVDAKPPNVLRDNTSDRVTETLVIPRCFNASLTNVQADQLARSHNVDMIREKASTTIATGTPSSFQVSDTSKIRLYGPKSAVSEVTKQLLHRILLDHDSHCNQKQSPILHHTIQFMKEEVRLANAGAAAAQEERENIRMSLMASEKEVEMYKRLLHSPMQRNPATVHCDQAVQVDNATADTSNRTTDPHTLVENTLREHEMEMDYYHVLSERKMLHSRVHSLNEMVAHLRKINDRLMRAGVGDERVPKPSVVVKTPPDDASITQPTENEAQLLEQVASLTERYELVRTELIEHQKQHEEMVALHTLWLREKRAYEVDFIAFKRTEEKTIGLLNHKMRRIETLETLHSENREATQRVHTENDTLRRALEEALASNAELSETLCRANEAKQIALDKLASMELDYPLTPTD